MIPKPFRHSPEPFRSLSVPRGTIPIPLGTIPIFSEHLRNTSDHYIFTVPYLRHTRNLKCVTLRVRDLTDMSETPLETMIISGTWRSIMTPVRSTKHLVVGHQTQVSIPFVTIQYSSENWSSISPYLVHSRYRRALFTRSVIWCPCDLNHMSSWHDITEKGPEVSLSVTRSDKSHYWLLLFNSCHRNTR